jgi:hypothetical protein
VGTRARGYDLGSARAFELAHVHASSARVAALAVSMQCKIFVDEWIGAIVEIEYLIQITK